MDLLLKTIVLGAQGWKLVLSGSSRSFPELRSSISLGVPAGKAMLMQQLLSQALLQLSGGSFPPVYQRGGWEEVSRNIPQSTNQQAQMHNKRRPK